MGTQVNLRSSGQNRANATLHRAQAEARAILAQQKTLSRSQYVFVRFGDRVANRSGIRLPYRATPCLSSLRSEVARSHSRRCRAAFDSSRCPNGFWGGGSRCVYNTADRWTRFCYDFGEVCASGVGDDSVGGEPLGAVPESRSRSTASRPRNCA